LNGVGIRVLTDGLVCERDSEGGDWGRPAGRTSEMTCLASLSHRSELEDPLGTEEEGTGKLRRLVSSPLLNGRSAEKTPAARKVKKMLVEACIFCRLFVRESSCLVGRQETPRRKEVKREAIKSRLRSVSRGGSRPRRVPVRSRRQPICFFPLKFREGHRSLGRKK